MNILFDSDTHLFWEEEGIICFSYKVPVVDLEIVKQGLEIRNEILDKNPHLFFGDLTGVHNITNEARQFYSSEESSGNVIAAAVLTSNAITKIIATFFQSFNRPKVPFKFFSSKEKAFQWLHEIAKGK